jgi:hypothetical protein
MKLLQSTGSISMGPDLPFRPYNMKMKAEKPKRNISDGQVYSDVNPEGKFRWIGQNPETGRIIFYNDRWFGVSDDDGQTWRPITAAQSGYKPGQGESNNGASYDSAAKTQTHLFTWCGGKQWICNTTGAFGRFLWTLDDFETIRTSSMDNDINGFDSTPWNSLKYDPINDEIWTTWGKGKIVQFDSNLDTWLNESMMGAGPNALIKWSDGPAQGLLSKKQIFLRKGYTTGSVSGFNFMDIGLSGHGTKIAYTQLGILVRSEDNFQTYEEINCLNTYNDPYYGQYGSEDRKEPIPGNGYNLGRIRYFEETGVWVLCGKASFQVSFDDGISWSRIDYKTRATKDDTLMIPFVYGPFTGSSEPQNYAYWEYYPTFNHNFNCGYIKGTYYYLTQETGDPLRNNPTHWKSSDKMDDRNFESISRTWCPENVIYVTNDLRNWTRFSLGFDLGEDDYNNGLVRPGNKTAVISHQPNVDRIFLLSDGYYRQTPYRVNYIDGFF